MPKLVLPITLTPVQQAADASPSRFKMLNWGRRVGKTWFEAYTEAKWMLGKPRGKFWYVTKTLNLGREEFWPALLNLLPRDLIAKTDERLLTVRLTNGSTLYIKSGEKEDNLRGRGLDGVVLDEAAFLKERLWDQIIRPQLGHSKGPALIASSPKKGWFTRLFKEAAKGTDPAWYASHATIYDSTLDPVEIEVIRSKTPDSTWRQEYMAEELANVGQVYDEFCQRNIYNPKERFTDVRQYPCVIGLDWGWAATTGVGWVCISPEGYIVIPAVHAQNRRDVPYHSQIIHSRSAGYSVKNYVLDRSAFRDEGTSATSIAKLFAKEGIVCQPSEKDVQASLDIVKRFMRGDGQTPWLYISSDCGEAIQAFQDWEHGDHEPDLAAAIRYAVVWAVLKRLTRLSDVVPTLRPATAPISKADAQLLLAAKAMVRPTYQKQARWMWDSQAGVPY